MMFSFDNPRSPLKEGLQREPFEITVLMKREKLQALRSDFMSTRELRDHPHAGKRDRWQWVHKHTWPCMCTVLIYKHIRTHTCPPHTHTYLPQVQMNQHHNSFLILKCVSCVEDCFSMYDNKIDLTVKYMVELNESHIQEPVIVFFHCLSYPNGDRLRRVMPEGHWSLSTLPGNGLSVRMGLEGSLRFFCLALC